MAYLTKDALIELLTGKGITFDPTASRDTLLSLLADSEGGALTENEVADTVEAGSKGIRFHLNSLVIKHRDFTPEDHGENWAEVAAEFRNTNKFNITGEEAL